MTRSKNRIHIPSDCVDVVVNTRHVISQSNKLPKQINLPTSFIIFCFRNKEIMDPIFLEIFATRGWSKI